MDKTKLEAVNASTIWLDDLRSEDVGRAGGKNANLGELISFKIPVPLGFAVLSQAFERFLAASGLREKIRTTLRESFQSLHTPADLEEMSRKIRRMVESASVPDSIASAIEESYRELSRRARILDVAVAVRSSVTAEDTASASFAGQHDTFLFVRGADAVIEHVKKCWSSLYTPRAITYRREKGLLSDGMSVAVTVQKMVNSEVSGIIFTIDPVTGDDTKLVIESVWGLGEAVVSGAVTPDRFIVDKATNEIVRSEMADKAVEYSCDTDRKSVVHRTVPASRRKRPSLIEKQVKFLSGLAAKIESHFGCPQDIEFAIDRDLPQSDNVFVVQARPETVWRSKAAVVTKPEIAQMDKPVLRGIAASPGVRYGEAKIAMTVAEAAMSVKRGDILVTKMTKPDWVPYMKLAGSIVTDEGGATCHAAIVSRELGIPCVVGTKSATTVLAPVESYTVDGKLGLVFRGRTQVASSTERPAEQAVGVGPSGPVTATRIYVNMSMPELAEKTAAETRADGVGLLRAEHMMLSVGKHPRLLIEEGGGNEMVEKFAEGIREVARAFHPRPVVYRFLDFKPDEFLNLQGGEKYELEAGHVGANPMIGYRGCFRFVKEPDVFRLECRTIRKVRDEFGLKNVWVMLPFVRTVEEFLHAKKLMEEEGLKRSADFKVWIMVEVPSTCLLIDEFVKLGIDGISFGTNDLTMLILGIDRNDAAVQEIYDERNPAVMRAMQHVIRTCRRAGVTTSVCGQAPSNYPELVEFLIREGVTSLSVNPDRVAETRLLVASIEQRLILDQIRAQSKSDAQTFQF